jgi:hypothetical protein
MKNEKRKGRGGDRTQVLRITDLVLYLSATAAVWNQAVWNRIEQNRRV